MMPDHHPLDPNDDEDPSPHFLEADWSWPEGDDDEKD